jgi:hypothetical protein
MKADKSAVRYTPSGTPEEHCALCSHFLGSNQCQLVQGWIAPQGWCNRFNRKPEGGYHGA